MSGQSFRPINISTLENRNKTTSPLRNSSTSSSAGSINNSQKIEESKPSPRAVYALSGRKLSAKIEKQKELIRNSEKYEIQREEYYQRWPREAFEWPKWTKISQDEAKLEKSPIGEKRIVNSKTHSLQQKLKLYPQSPSSNYLSNSLQDQRDDENVVTKCYFNYLNKIKKEEKRVEDDDESEIIFQQIPTLQYCYSESNLIPFQVSKYIFKSKPAIESHTVLLPPSANKVRYNPLAIRSPSRPNQIKRIMINGENCKNKIINEILPLNQLTQISLSDLLKSQEVVKFESPKIQYTSFSHLEKLSGNEKQNSLEKEEKFLKPIKKQQLFSQEIKRVFAFRKGSGQDSRNDQQNLKKTKIISQRDGNNFQLLKKYEFREQKQIEYQKNNVPQQI